MVLLVGQLGSGVTSSPGFSSAGVFISNDLVRSMAPSDVSSDV